MLTAAVSLIVYIAVAFFPADPEPRYAVFPDKQSCEQAVAQARARGLFVTDCVKVDVGKPSNDKDRS